MNEIIKDYWYNIDSYFLEVMPTLIRALSERTASYPDSEVSSFEEWKQTLNEMADCFEIGRMYQYATDFEDRIAANEIVDKGLAMFTKYFHHLWD